MPEPLIVAFDIETQSADNPYEGGLNPRRDKILSWAVAFSDGRPPEYALWRDEGRREGLKKALFANDGRVIVGANVKFDMQFLQAAWGEIPEHVKLQDTIHLCWLLNENEKNYKLSTLVWKYCGFKMKEYGEFGVQGNLFDNCQPVEEKCKQDVEWTLQLYRTRYTQLLKYPALVKVFENLYSPLIRVVMEMESEGVLVDRKRLAEMYHNYWLQIKECGKEVKKYGYYDGLTRNQKFSEFLFGKLRAQPRPFMLDKPKRYRMAKVPLWKVDKEILYEYQDEFPVCKVKLEHSRLHTIYKMFLKKWPTLLEGDKMYPSIFQTRSNKEAREKDIESGTDSGRWAFTNPNLLQLDRESELRSLIIAPTGYKIVYADLNQAELRMLAHVTKDPTLVDCYRRNLDLHSITVEALGNVPRILGKEANFGLAYGIGPFKFSRRVLVRTKGAVRVGEEEARRIRDGWYAKYAAIEPFKRRTERELAGSGYVETIAKRRRRLGDMYAQEPADALRIAVNAKIQGSVADGIGIALLNMRKIRDPRTRFWIQVYDSVVLIAPSEIAEQEGKKLQECMESCLKLDVPLKAQYGIGDNLKEAEKNAH
jgi:DNA polymerase-1